MDKIRIGKDIYISWQLTASDPNVTLSQENLTLEITTPNNCIATLPFEFENGTLTANFYGIDQPMLGRYWLTVWYKQGEVGQSALDKVLAFQLVKSTEEETHSDDSIAYAEVNLTGTIDIMSGWSGGGGTVELEYYSEDTSRHSAKIDTGSGSINLMPDDDGYISVNALHVTIYDGTSNSLTVGRQGISSQVAGVQVNTATGEKFLYNEDEVATKQDVSNCVTVFQLEEHTSNSSIHVTAADKSRWDAKQDSLMIDTSLNIHSSNPVTNAAIASTIEDNELIWAQALNELDRRKADKTFDFVSLTQSQYDALTTKDSSTIYFITA